jgi:hypothetical protein
MTDELKKQDWSTKKEKEIISLVNDFYDEDQKFKMRLARTWEENIRFIEGEQYIRWNAQARTYDPIPSRADREYIPKANDNQTYVRAEILRANLTRQKPKFNVTPNSNDPIDEKKSKVALAVHDTRSELDDDDIINGSCADWAVATGNAFKKTTWEPFKKIKVIDQMGRPELGEDGSELEAPIGDVVVSEVPPFNIAMDLACSDISQGEVVMEYSAQLVSQIREWYDQKGPGYTGKAKQVKEEEIRDGVSVKIVEDLKHPIGETRPIMKDRAILKEVYIKPSEKLPNGRMIVMAGDIVVYDNDSPYGAINKKKWHPYDHFKYFSQAGNPWGTTPITQVVRLQRRLNAIDTMAILHRQTMALGQWLIPQNSVPDGMMSGRVGLKVVYRETPGGNKPERIPGTQLGQDVLAERQGVVLAMDTICGTTDVMQGRQPGSIESGVSLEFIREMSFSRFNPMYERWEKFNESAAKRRLQLIAKKQIFNIPFFTDQLRKKLRSITAMDIQSFVGSELSDNTNVRIVAGSSIPMSHAAKLANLQKFGEAGLLGDLIQDPMKNQLFLDEFNIDSFKTEQNVDFEKAKYNLSLIESGMMDGVQFNPRDNPQVHIKYFLTKLKDPEWYSARPPEILKAAWKYVEQFEKLNAKNKQKMIQQQMAAQDVEAYRQSLVNNGGPDGEPPSLSLFPSVLSEKVTEDEQREKAQAGPQGPPMGPVQ